jgi:hypothetical protein
VFDNLTAYYHENVISSFIEYRNICTDGVAGGSRDLRAALNAASALFHLREHLPIVGSLSRADVERACPDYALLGDVVNASKHKALKSKTPHGAPLVTDAENLGEQLIFIEYEDDAGAYRYIQKTVVVKLTDGSERNLLAILTNVINFWEGHLLAFGVLSKARVFSHDADIRYRTRSEVSPLSFELMQGHRFHQTVRLLRFDKATGKAKPIDLSGSEVKFRICKPKYDIGLSLTHNASGETFKTEIALTEEESFILSQMSTDEERQAYVDGLPVAQAALQRLAVEAGLSTGS